MDPVLATQEAERIMQLADKNDDKKINYTEFLMISMD